MKKVLFLLTCVLALRESAFCQSVNFNETLSVVHVKYPPLSDIIQQVLKDDEGRDYFSDTLNYMLLYDDTTISRNIVFDTNPSYSIDSGTVMYLFVFSPCPEGIPTLDDDTVYLLEHDGHYFYLIGYKGYGHDSILFSDNNDSVSRDKILQTYAEEDDRWPEYFYYSSIDSNGRLFWRKYSCHKC